MRSWPSQEDLDAAFEELGRRCQHASCRVRFACVDEAGSMGDVVVVSVSEGAITSMVVGPSDAAEVELSVTGPADLVEGYLRGALELTALLERCRLDGEFWYATVVTGVFESEWYRLAVQRGAATAGDPSAVEATAARGAPVSGGG